MFRRVSRMKSTLAAALVFALASPALAQLSLPGFAPDSPTPPPAPSAAPAGGSPTAPRPEKRRRRPRPAAVESAAPFRIDPSAALGKDLQQNGRYGALRIARGPDGSLQIAKFTMLGEVISNPQQKCRIDIVADQPIPAVAKGEPDGLPRYSADIAACPLTFDVVDGGALVPAQANACVFQAADCQASPSGLWGPPSSELEPKAISKARSAADRAIQSSLRILERHDADAAASLAREESDFAAERDDVCRDYAGENRLQFCASRLTESRAALLAKRAAEAGPAPPPSKRRRGKR